MKRTYDEISNSYPDDADIVKVAIKKHKAAELPSNIIKEVIIISNPVRLENHNLDDEFLGSDSEELLGYQFYEDDELVNTVHSDDELADAFRHVSIDRTSLMGDEDCF
jgi:hypothetical protein